MTPLTHAAASEAPTATQVSRRSVLRRLRKLVPEQSFPFSWRAAERIAEHQSSLLRRLARTAATDPVGFVENLPAIVIRFVPDLPRSSESHWDETSKHWVIQIVETRSTASRRFLILHELKHILDHGKSVHLYDPHFRRGPLQAQMAGDHFAACVLMPAAEMRRAIRDGLTTTSSLAKHFDVPKHRVVLRLNDLNLINKITDN